MKKRVLITGMYGAIGAHVFVHIMKNTDWDVIAIDSFRHKGYRERIDSFSEGHPDWLERLTTYQYDLVSFLPQDLKDKIGKVDYILHLAALSDVQLSVDNPVYTIKNNIDSTISMLEYAREVKPELFLYFSTDEIYGPVEGDTTHKEWDTHYPSNPYAASKAASEDICYCYWRAYDVPLIITNTMNNWGQTQGASKFPAMIQRKLMRGETVTIHGTPDKIGSRFYIHSRNVADALLFIIKNGVKHHIPGELDHPHKYHIVGDRRLNNLELAQMIAGYMGKELKYEFQDFHLDNLAHDIHYGMEDTKLKKMGWSAPVSLEDGLKSMIEWQLTHPEWIEG
jgi:dTDP-D-glucose 4,6-dehydratase